MTLTEPGQPTPKKQKTCIDWWLRKCPHTDVTCNFAHQLFYGRATSNLNLGEQCQYWANGNRCMWPARLCGRAHSDKPTPQPSRLRLLNAAFGLGYTQLPDEQRLCKVCDVCVADSEWALHITPGLPMSCLGV